MQRSAVYSVIAVLLVLVGACGQDESMDRSTDTPMPETAERSAATADVDIRPAPAFTTAPRRHRPRTPAPAPTTRADLRLVRDFVRLAITPSPETASRVPLADELALGLSRDIAARLDRTQAANLTAWELHAEYFRAAAGPFNALTLIQRHVEEAGSGAVGDKGAFRV